MTATVIMRLVGRGALLDGPLRDTRGEFLRGADGRVRFLRVGGRVYRRTRG